MKKSGFFGATILFVAAFIWGSSFVAQSIGMERIEAFTYNGVRTLMGAAVLLPIVLWRDARQKRGMDAEQRAVCKQTAKKTWLAGLMLGAALCVASNFQQFAFIDSTSGKIAFITALYMLFVPILGLVLGRRLPPLMWGCVALGAVGLWFLSIPAGGFADVNRGDVLALCCAFFFAVQILLVERFAAKYDPVKLTFVQFLSSGAVSVLLMFLFESPSVGAINSAIWPLLYSGVLSCGIAYTFQTIGQKYTPSTLASLIMCMESVFGVLSGAVILHEIPTGRELLGCALMLCAIVAAQFADRKKKRDVGRTHLRMKQPQRRTYL